MMVLLFFVILFFKEMHEPYLLINYKYVAFYLVLTVCPQPVLTLSVRSSE